MGLGVVVVLLGGLWLALTLTSPSSSGPTPAIERDVPDDWLSPSPIEAEATTETLERPVVEPKTEAMPSSPPSAFETSGSLALVSRGKSFGDESYRLSVTDRGTHLESTGTFRFKVVVATIGVSFEQNLETDEAQRPTRYTLDFDAPLGFGQTIDAEVSEDRLIVVRNGDETSAPFASDSLYVVGTFSSYALLPVYFAEHPEIQSRSYDVLSFGGPSGGQSAGEKLPTMFVERFGSARLHTETHDIDVERYRVASDMGEGVLYARDRELLAFAAGDEEGDSLIVYRVDFFPLGIEIID